MSEDYSVVEESQKKRLACIGLDENTPAAFQ